MGDRGAEEVSITVNVVRHNQVATVVVTAALAVAAVAALTFVGLHRPHPTKSKLTGPTSQLTVVTPLDFKCSLPVVSLTGGGLVSFPSADLQIDPAVKPYSATAPTMYLGPLSGNAGPTSAAYDAKAGKWLAGVKPAWISSDGKSYGFNTQTEGVPGQPPTSDIYTEEVATSQRTHLWSGSGQVQLLGFGSGGLYFNLAPISPLSSFGTIPNSLASVDLWVVDPARPTQAHRVGPNPPPAPVSPATAYQGPPDTFTAVGADAAWGIGYTQVQVPVPSGAPTGFGNPAAGPPTEPIPHRVIRMSLTDGAVSDYYTAPDTDFVSLEGLDSLGRPLIVVSNPITAKGGSMPSTPPLVTSQIELVTAPDQTQLIADGSDFHPTSEASDSHGIWLGSSNGIWLYSKAAGLRRIVDFPTGTFPSPSPAPTPSFPANYTPKPMPSGMASGARIGLPPGYTGPPVFVAGGCS